MQAFRIRVDGRSLGDLGVENFGNASVIVGFGRHGSAPASFDLHIGGLTQPDEDGICRHYRWSCPDIAEGSRIEIELVDSDDCVQPAKIYRSDHEVQESAFTDDEMREMRYRNFLKLKKEFEP